jgi:hypothetical protein
MMRLGRNLALHDRGEPPDEPQWVKKAGFISFQGSTVDRQLFV